MKQFFLLAVLSTFLAAAHVQAQSCSYAKSAATKAAVLEDNISKRFDEATGQTIYVRKEVCTTSGKVSYVPVEYCSKSGKFVNVSPREKHCVKSRSKCTAKGGKATKVSASEKVNCTAAQKAACAKACPGARKSGASATKVKLVKNR